MVEYEMVTEVAAGRGDVRDRQRCRQELVTEVSGKPEVMPRYEGKEKDMNVTEKARSKEYVNEEDHDVRDRSVSRKELNVHPKDQEEERVQSKEVVLQGVKKRKVRSADSLCKKPALGGVVLFAVLLVLVTPAQGAEFHPSKQVLPRDCVEMLVDKGCPDPDPDFNEWRVLVEPCCEDYPDSVFHCQKYELNGEPYIMAACLPKQWVPPGKIGRLILNGTGYPELDLISNCKSPTYRSKSIESSLIRFRHCTERKIRPQDQKDVICDGGPSADYLFICKEGSTSRCSHAFSGDDCGFCIPLHCEEGSKPLRNVTGKCDDGDITVEYGCTPEAGPLSTTTGWTSGDSESTPIVSTTSSPAHTTAPGQHPDGNMSGGEIAGIVVSVICIIAIGILSCYGCWLYYSKRRNNSRMSPASGSSSESSRDEKDSTAVLMNDIEDP